MITREKYKESFDCGEEMQTQFAKDIATHGYKTKKSTRKQDINEHWDLEMISTMKIDVKALKRINRRDKNPQETYHYVEIKNVSGENGWCYSNVVEGFAFETLDYWVVVKKEDLQNLIKEKVKKIYSERPALYMLYSRPGRKDVLTLVKTLDLMFISFLRIKKTVE